MPRPKKVTVVYCTLCGMPKPDESAVFCNKCGTRFDDAGGSTALVVSRASGVPATTQGLEFIANDLARLESGWGNNRELVRRDEWFWRLIGRDLSRHEIRQRVKEMQSSLEKLDEQTYVGRHALERQHFLERQQSRNTLQLAEEELVTALHIFNRLIDQIEDMVSRLGLSASAQEDLTTHLIHELVLKRLGDTVAKKRPERRTKTITEVQRQMEELFLDLNNEEGDNDEEAAGAIVRR
jgi:hypothetical protein